MRYVVAELNKTNKNPHGTGPFVASGSPTQGQILIAKDSRQACAAKKKFWLLIMSAAQKRKKVMLKISQQ